jgi:hypothetical protein
MLEIAKPTLAYVRPRHRVRIMRYFETLERWTRGEASDTEVDEVVRGAYDFAPASPRAGYAISHIAFLATVENPLTLEGYGARCTYVNGEATKVIRHYYQGMPQ